MAHALLVLATERRSRRQGARRSCALRYVAPAGSPARLARPQRQLRMGGARIARAVPPVQHRQDRLRSLELQALEAVVAESRVYRAYDHGEVRRIWPRDPEH